jgi:CHASE2 domain-containing sensor protein
MSDSRPFIPRNKPRFWVIGVLAGLAGLGFGVLAFCAAWLGVSILKACFMAAFIACWAIFVVAWFGCLSGFISGRYRGLSDKPWRDQVW